MSEVVSKKNEQEKRSSRLSEGRRVAAVATIVTLFLVLGKGFFGYLRHSPALTADAVHSGADTLAIFASWLGLKLAERPPTKQFPFGLYRAETLASLVVSAFILIAGIKLLIESVSGLIQQIGPVYQSVEVMVVALVSAVLSYGIFVWEERVGKRLNSQSLLANADESRADVMTSLAVFVGTGATYFGLPRVELVVAGGLSLLIIWLGLKHGRLALYVLLDASLNPELERQAMKIATEVPGVMQVEQLRLRRSGPFFFGITHILLRKSIDVARAHEVAHKVVRAVREAMPQIEMLTVHTEPYRPDLQTVMVPSTDKSVNAAVSDHFGRAKFFVFATVSSVRIKETDFVENPFREKTARAGLTIIKDTVRTRKVDAVLTRKIGEIAFHTLRDYYVEIYQTPEGTVLDALTKFAKGGLSPLGEPTHASEAAGKPAG